MATDLYAPPTPEELSALKIKAQPSQNSQDLYAPPSPDELKSLNIKTSAPEKTDQSFGQKALGLVAKYFDPVGTVLNNPKESQAAIEGVGQGGLIGYLPEAQAAAGGLIPNSPGFDEEAFKKPDKFGVSGKIEEPESTYESRLDENRKAQKEYKKANPKSYMAGQFTGALTTAPAAGYALEALGAGGAISGTGALSGAAQGALQGAKGGAILGAASNPNEEPGQRGFNLPGRVSNMGSGAAIGGALGGVVGGLVGKYGTKSEIQPESSPSSPELNKTVQVDEPQAQPTQNPKNVEDLKSQVESMKNQGIISEPKAPQELERIVKDNPDLPKPIPGFHDQMLKGRQQYMEARARAAAPDQAGQAIREYESGMKSVAEKKLADLVSTMGDRPPLDKIESGGQLTDAVSDSIKSEKQRLSPQFEQFNDLSLPKQKIVPEIQNKIVQDIPKLRGVLGFDQSGNMTLQPFNTKMGIGKESYSVLNEMVSDLNSKQLSFKDLQNMREYARTNMDPTNPKSTQILSDVRKSMLGYMQDMVQEKNPNIDVRKTFQDYAKNEQNREQFESIIGGKLESTDQLMTANPEKVLDRIFSNTNNVDVTKNVIGEKAFNNLKADYVHSLIQKSTQNGVLKSGNLFKNLQAKEPALRAALKPEEAQRIEDLVQYMHMVPDTPMPSFAGPERFNQNIANIIGSAAHGNLLGAGKEAVGLIHGVAKNAGENSRSINELNGLMSGTPPNPVRSGNIYGSGTSSFNGKPMNLNLGAAALNPQLKHKR